jgi:hypothetical protein
MRFVGLGRLNGRILLAAVGLLSSLALPIPAAATWEYVENRDPHSKGLVAMARFSDPSGAHAMVRCWSATGLLDVRIGFPGVDRYALQSLALAFDDASALPANFRLSPNRRTVIIAPADRAPVLEGLRRALVVHIAAGFDNGAEERVAMRLNGSSRAISQVETNCVR